MSDTENGETYEVLKSIWLSWHDGEEGSICHGCGRRDECKVWHPVYGAGDVDADIVILGEAPGGNRSIGPIDGRYSKNLSLRAERDGFELPDIRTRFANSQYLKPLRHLVDGFRNEGMTSYYTNATKCEDIHSGKDLTETEAQNLRDDGKERCRDHLSKELSAIDPDAVVVFSKAEDSHLSEMVEYFDCEENLPTGNERVTEQVFDQSRRDKTQFRYSYSEKYDLWLFPSYHFAMAGTNFSQNVEYTSSEWGYPSASGVEDRYFHELARTVAARVSEA